ncbi:hypothetical protein PVAP13_6KG383030 [Panicum virgatum]|uniref:Uncharacterized protein n=1 Tax=Panicum virgatum TaxID=38727 RepID=A0A8T0RJS0_PANVG|nr:hypothetical protein PVAP13_6KG383030 [Panicum virgatum]
MDGARAVGWFFSRALLRTAGSAPGYRQICRTDRLAKTMWVKQGRIRVVTFLQCLALLGFKQLARNKC